ncbi:MAG TPA: RNA methyltransferase [Firmicutes bacterium]|jgi:TrmH family RNA methyltransferase|nr:RNA methyltransferase [Bacillota bacterium]HHT42558.1 RNA methyltransferase [Bacillota bacterium]
MSRNVRIVSRQNERIREAKKLAQKKHRDATGRFCLEGVRLVEEALTASLVEELFFTERLLQSPRGRELVQRAQTSAVQVYECSEPVLEELTDTVNSQGVAAVARKPAWELQPQGLMLIADEIQDPGNMGALLRTGVGAGARTLFVVKGSVDVYSPKVVRASMGAIFHLPHQVVDRPEVLELMEKRGIALVVADLENAQDFWTAAYPQDVAVVIGNEARGVHASFRDQAALRVRIPLVGPVESLNASVAAGVLLYEILRQYRCSRPESVL